MRVKEIAFTGRIGWFMHRRGWAGVTLPLWPWIVICYWLTPEDSTRRHERIHVAQIEHMGRLRFAAVYLWQLLRHGYKHAPLELEAYNGAAPPPPPSP